MQLAPVRAYFTAQHAPHLMRAMHADWLILRVYKIHVWLGPAGVQEMYGCECRGTLREASFVNLSEHAYAGAADVT